MAIEYNPSGIISRKYIVTNADGSLNDKNATFWVFRIDEDLHAASALIAYIQIMEAREGMTELSAALSVLAREHSYKAFKRLGIKKIYNVAKEDGASINPEAKYFVVRVDQEHPYSQFALKHYANVIRPERPRLARDIKELVECKTWKEFGLLI